MTRKKAFLFWLSGVIVFIITLALHAPLILTAVPGGILDHQAGGTGAEITRIQAAWRAAGVGDQAIVAMSADLAFIVIYSAMSIIAGRYLLGGERAAIKRTGLIVIAAAAVFFVTDIIETSAQLIQLLNGNGSDGLAGLAAAVRPIKIAAWIVTFVGVIAGFLWVYRNARRAA